MTAKLWYESLSVGEIVDGLEAIGYPLTIQGVVDFLLESDQDLPGEDFAAEIFNCVLAQEIVNEKKTMAQLKAAEVLIEHRTLVIPDIVFNFGITKLE